MRAGRLLLVLISGHVGSVNEWVSNGITVDRRSELYLPSVRLALTVTTGIMASLPNFRKNVLERCGFFRDGDDIYDYLSAGYDYFSSSQELECTCAGVSRCIMHLLNQMEERDALRLLAFLLAAALRVDLDWSELYDSISLLPGASPHIRRLEEVREYLRDDVAYHDGDKVDLVKYLKSKVFMIQALVDSYIHLHPTRPYSIFYGQFHSLVKEGYYAKADSTSHTDHEEMLGIANDGIVPSLQAKFRNTACELHPSHNTPNFIGSHNATLSLLCTLLYNTGTYSLEHLPNARPELEEFFRKHDVPFECTEEIEAEWIGVLDAMGDGMAVEGEGIGPIFFNLFRIIRNLCGLDNEFPLTEYYTRLLSSEDLLEHSEHLGRLLSRVCSHKQHFYIIPSCVTSVWWHGRTDTKVRLMFKVLLSREHWVSVQLTCGNTGSSFVVKECSCIKSSMNVMLKVDNVLDFFIDCHGRSRNTHAAYKNELRRCLEQNPEYILLLSNEFESRQSLHLCLLDSAVARCSSDFDVFLAEAEHLYGDHPAIKAYRLIVQHRDEGGAFDPGNEIDIGAIVEEMRNNAPINLLCYIARHKEKLGVGELRELFPLLLKHERCDVAGHLEMSQEEKAESLVRYPYYLDVSDRRTIKCLFDAASAGLVLRKKLSFDMLAECYERCYINFLADPAISREDAKKIYDWGFVLAGQLKEGKCYEFRLRYLPFLVEQAHEKLGDISPIYSYVQKHLMSRRFYGFTVFLLEFLLRECIYLPYSLCSKMKELYDVSYEETPGTRRILELLSDLMYEGLSVENDKVEDIAFLLSKNPVNGEILGKMSCAEAGHGGSSIPR
jgi:hypothetical protein